MTRRSIRRYSEKEVSAELLNRLMTEAGRTQTMGNLQLYSYLCRLQPHVDMGKVQERRTGVRQFPQLHQCGDGRAAVHADAM